MNLWSLLNNLVLLWRLTLYNFRISSLIIPFGFARDNSCMFSRTWIGIHRVESSKNKIYFNFFCSVYGHYTHILLNNEKFMKDFHYNQTVNNTLQIKLWCFHLKKTAFIVKACVYYFDILLKVPILSHLPPRS